MPSPMLTEMKLKRGDKVKLMPCYPSIPSEMSPVWGSTFGYRVGTVIKLLTGEHDVTKHMAMVEWPNTRGTVNVSGHFERVLELATKNEIDFSEDWRCGIPFNDIFIMLRMSSNRIVVNCIECPTFATPPERQTFTLTTTKHAISTPDASNFNVVDAMLSFPDTEAVANQPTLLGSVRQITRRWNLPDPDTFNMPLPTFRSFCEAAAKAPAINGPAIAFFHLEESMADIYTGAAK